MQKGWKPGTINLLTKAESLACPSTFSTKPLGKGFKPDVKSTMLYFMGSAHQENLRMLCS